VAVGGDPKGDSKAVGVGRGDSAGVEVGSGVSAGGAVALSWGVAVALASTTVSVGVAVGFNVGGTGALLVGVPLGSTDSTCSVFCRRVALGTIVMRGSEDPASVGVDVGNEVGLGRVWSSGVSVGEGVRRRQAPRANATSNNPINRFISRSLVAYVDTRIEHERANKPDSVPDRSGWRPSI
jgi:hypothetical protein